MQAYVQKAGGRGIMMSHQEMSGIPNHMSTRFDNLSNALIHPKLLNFISFWTHCRLQTTIFRNMFGAQNCFIAADDQDVPNIQVRLLALCLTAIRCTT